MFFVFMGMSKIIRLKESDIRRIVKLVFEQEGEDWEFFSKLDYVHAFIKVFKNWIETTKQINFADFPFSYLLEKYGREFAIQHKLIEGEEEDDDDEDEEDRYDVRTLERWGRDLMRLGLIKYPSLREQGTFMGRFGKAIERFTAMKKYPNYMKVEISEPKNFVLQPKVSIDMEAGLKSDYPRSFSKYDFIRELEEYVKNILGIEIGSPAMGRVRFEYPIVDTDKDRFIEEVVNKVIKKEIRKLPDAKHLQSIRLEFSDQPSMTLKLIFKGYPGYNEKSRVRDGAREILQRMGFAQNKVKVTM